MKTRSFPRLERLEDRCLPSTVINLKDSGSGSLRQAILETPPGGIVDFRPGLSGTIGLTSGQLFIANSLTIAGPVAGSITIDGRYNFRVFNIPVTATVNISDLTIIRGQPRDGDPGGGILNYGKLAITNSTILHNCDGGIENFLAGVLTLTDSTIAGNCGSIGGGIENLGTLTVSDSTISGNNAFYFGVGIANFGTAKVSESTISNNVCVLQNNCGGGVGIGGVGASLEIHNTIIAGNVSSYAPDVNGTVLSLGHNLIGNPEEGHGWVPSDLLNADPLLGPLKDNGGLTQTMALLRGSPAIDAGDNTGAPMWEQRGTGFPRIEHGIIDIGAFEYHFRQPQLDPEPVWLAAMIGDQWTKNSAWAFGP